MNLKSSTLALFLSGCTAIVSLTIILANQLEQSGDSTLQKRESIMRLSMRPSAEIR